jgi:hypothetical protein
MQTCGLVHLFRRRKFATKVHVRTATEIACHRYEPLLLF